MCDFQVMKNGRPVYIYAVILYDKSKIQIVQYTALFLQPIRQPKVFQLLWIL